MTDFFVSYVFDGPSFGNCAMGVNSGKKLTIQDVRSMEKTLKMDLDVKNLVILNYIPIREGPNEDVNKVTVNDD